MSWPENFYPSWGEHFKLPSTFWQIPRVQPSPNVRIKGGISKTPEWNPETESFISGRGHIHSWVEIENAEGKKRIWTSIKRGYGEPFGKYK